MKYTPAAVAGATMLLASMVEGHGFIKSPQARMPGDAFKAACGATMASTAKSDHYENVQAEIQHANNQADYNKAECPVWQCKGYKFADNGGNVQKYHAGQTVPMEFEIKAPHTGVANVSIVDTATDKIIGQPLKSWTNFASNSGSNSADQTTFEIKMPQKLPPQCKKAGKCVIQHYWDAADINQTYESCVDFTWTGDTSAGDASAGDTSADDASAGDASGTTAATPADDASGKGADEPVEKPVETPTNQAKDSNTCS